MNMLSACPMKAPRSHCALCGWRPRAALGMKAPWTTDSPCLDEAADIVKLVGWLFTALLPLGWGMDSEKKTQCLEDQSFSSVGACQCANILRLSDWVHLETPLPHGVSSSTIASLAPMKTSTQCMPLDSFLSACCNNPSWIPNGKPWIWILRSAMSAHRLIPEVGGSLQHSSYSTSKELTSYCEPKSLLMWQQYIDPWDHGY